MKAYKYLIITLVATLFLSCAGYINTLSADGNIKNVAIGMNQEQVISIMGSNYSIDHSSVDADGATNLVLTYPRNSANSFYSFHFVNNSLKEFNKEWTPTYIEP